MVSKEGQIFKNVSKNVAGNTGIILFYPLILPQNSFLFHLELHAQSSITRQYQSIRNVLSGCLDEDHMPFPLLDTYMFKQ